MFPLLDTLVHTLPLVLCFPSICLASFGIYIIQTKSTKSMKNYKKILIAIALVTLNFDISLSVLVGPKPLPGAVGTENSGFVAMWSPSAGRAHVLYILLSLAGQLEICVIGFSYREKAILKSHLPAWHKVYEAFQVLTYVLVAVATSMVYLIGAADENRARQYMNQTGRPYCQECSISVIPDATGLISCALVAGFSVVILNIFIGVSTFRIRRYLALEKDHLSQSTVKTQKMLLAALIWQYLVPFILITGPIILITISIFIVPLVTINSQSLEEDMTAISLLMPSFFSIGHCFCTIYFTTPYKKYVKELVTSRQKTAASSVLSIQVVK